ncbi:MAG: tetratricopeptide repeat protein [Bacteroidia bacterium]|nr:tetratricopeptide repeat protein [Bacteroidia bacterium]
MNIKLVFLLLFSVNVILGKNSITNVDSLLSVLPKANDTAKIKTLLEISKYYYGHGNIPASKDFCEQAIELAKKEKDVVFLASTFNQMGGMICNGIGDFSEALDYLLKAYRLIEKTSNKKLLYTVSNGLGNTYMAQKDLIKALEFYDNAFEIAEGLHDPYGISVILIGKGNVYEAQKDYKNALDAFSKAAIGFYNANSKYEYAIAQASIGNIYIHINENNKALKVLDDAYQIMRMLDDRYGMGQTLLAIGNAYRQKGNYEMSLVYYYNSMIVFKKSAAKYDLKSVYQEIAIAYNKQNKNDSAFHYIQLYSLIKDSIFSEENSKLIAEMQTKYESVKKEEENRTLLTQNELSENTIKQQNRLQLALSLFLGMVFIFSVFLYRSNKQKQKKNNIILSQKEKAEEQRMLLEFKNKEIVDSITYAKRLQEAILPPLKMIKKYLPGSFILYKPKDIVAGDFYWMEVVSSERMPVKTNLKEGADAEKYGTTHGERILIAAADCTGHGVPGAIVSVVCSNALNRTVKEFGISDPGKILDKVRELVVETFIRKDSQEIRNEVLDGMDISLISIEFDGDNAEGVTIKWAGANNPLWIIKKMKNASIDENVSSNSNLTASEFNLMEIKANKQSIGKTDAPMPFTTHSIQLNKGDQLYLFTDGYADQFGGEKGKKFKYQQLKETLLANAHKPMGDQSEILNNTMENWKGSLEQVDDILIIGICL